MGCTAHVTASAAEVRGVGLECRAWALASADPGVGQAITPEARGVYPVWVPASAAPGAGRAIALEVRGVYPAWALASAAPGPAALLLGRQISGGQR